MLIRCLQLFSLPVLLLALVTSCATPNHFATSTMLPGDNGHPEAFAQAQVALRQLFPQQYRATQRAIITAGGKQFTCDGLLQVSPTEGHHLAIVSSFGVVTDLRVATNGDCTLLKVTPLFREDWSRRFVARDLYRLFVTPSTLQPSGYFTNGNLCLQTAPDNSGVTAQYVFSPDGTRWLELNLSRDGKIFYHAVPGHFRKFNGVAAEIPTSFDVQAENYRLELRIAEMTLPPTEVSR
jgi:hypothetical protein